MRSEVSLLPPLAPHTLLLSFLQLPVAQPCSVLRSPCTALIGSITSPTSASPTDLMNLTSDPASRSWMRKH